MTAKATPLLRPPLLVIWVTALLVASLGVGLWTVQGYRLEQWGGRGDRELEGLQVFGTLPDFSLVERSGRTLTLADLLGKVWVANFIYTHCTDTCPLQSARMAQLQTELAMEPDVRLVSITVDPAQDTPKVLTEYAARFGADRERWLFLTGNKRAIYALAQGGFYLAVEDAGDVVPVPPGRRPPAARSGPGRRFSIGGLAGTLIRLLEPTPALAHPGHLSPPILHSSWFVLVDRQARIRGYYHSDDEKALDRLRRDVKALLKEKADGEPLKGFPRTENH